MHEVTQAAVQFSVTQVTETESPAADLILHTHWAIFCLSRAIPRQGPNIREDFPLHACSFLQRLSRVRRSGAQARAVQSISDINQFRPALQRVRCPASSKKDGGGSRWGWGGGGFNTVTFSSSLSPCLSALWSALWLPFTSKRTIHRTDLCSASTTRGVFMPVSSRSRCRFQHHDFPGTAPSSRREPVQRLSAPLRETGAREETNDAFFSVLRSQTRILDSTFPCHCLIWCSYILHL